MTGSGSGDHSLHELGPIRAMQTRPFELTEFKLRSQVGLVDLDGTMREFARQAAADLKGAIAELASPFDGLVETSLILGNPDEDLLGDARANIKEHAYDVALAQLEEYLEDHPEHQDARHLRAFCLFQLYLDDDARSEDALRILNKLAAELLPEALAARVRELRHVLRKRQTPRRVDAYATAARGNPKAALAAAEGYLDLVPEEGIMSYLVAVGQLRAGNMLQALDTAERGAALADGDRQRVADLARALRTPVLRALAATAVASFKAGDYNDARMDLAQLEPRWRSAQVVMDFDSYLGSLRGRPRGLPLPAPNLPADRADELYSLIADADAQQAMELIMAGRLEQAQALLDGLMLLVPDFPWLNFVYAFLLYQQERAPERAEACAALATRDRTIAQASELLRAVQEWRESIVINPLVDEFLAAMESVRGPAKPTQLAVLRARLAALATRLPQVRAATKTQAGRKMTAQLEQVIADRIMEIDEASVVNGLYDDYDKLVAGLQGKPVSSVAQLELFDLGLSGLATRVQAARLRLHTGPGVKQADELARRIAADRVQLAVGRTTIAIGDLVARFNQSGYLLPYANIRPQVRTEFQQIKQEAARLRQQAGADIDPRQRAALDKITEAITRVLR